MKKSNTGKQLVFVLIAGLLLVALICVIRYAEQNEKLASETRGSYSGSYNANETVTVNGQSYIRRDNVELVLIMGIDTSETTAFSGKRIGGQADFLRLMIIDHDQKHVSELQIDRDTILPISLYGILGDFLGFRNLQACLSYAYGSSREHSCRLTVEAISRMILGTKINYYISMNLDGVHVLNDFAGGITVTLEDDFSAIDPSMKPGATIRLQGKQAEIFIRSRMNVGDGTNESRMRRQQQYISRLETALDQKISESREAIGNLFDELSDCLNTDFSRGGLINLVWKSRNYSRSTVSIEGTFGTDTNGFNEFHYDEASLTQMILDLCYRKADR